MASKAFESPLISHIRMRALYRALVELRSVARSRDSREIEACLVAPPIDLRDGDLISDLGGKADATLLAHVRSVGRRPTAQAIDARNFKALTRQLISAKHDLFPGSAADRLICAAGAAMALQSAGNQNVVLAYVRHHELTRKDWHRFLRILEQPGLPIIVVLMPGTSRQGTLGPPAKKSTVPIIPVDAGDPVALYRVAQETIVRARAGGGASLIEGVACKTDPIKLLGSQLVRKGICTAAWIDRVQAHIERLSAAGERGA